MTKGLLIVLLSGGIIASPALSNPKRLRKRVKRDMNSTLDVLTPMDMYFANSRLNVYIAAPGQYTIVIIGPKGEVRQEEVTVSSSGQLTFKLSNGDEGMYQVLVAGSDGIRYLGAFYKEESRR